MEEEEEVVGGLEEGGKTSDSDSFSSDPRLSRQSPPTQVCSHSTSDVNVFLLSIIYLFSLTHLTSSSFFQVQSLSEESSGCSTRRRQPALSPSSPSTGSVESLDEGGRDPFGEGEGGGGGREASNPYVRIPVPRPRTSLLRRKQEEVEEEEEEEEIEEEDENGCDSDSTLDPRPRGQAEAETDWEEEGREGRRRWEMERRSRRRRREGERWSEEEEEEDVDREGGADGLSILTDGVAEQMMY